ncbi:MAG: calcium/sodium antiporter [Flavobacteriales bacterium]|nr:calcium/sodium antiporter [Flavobacteriales bacterium]
MEYVLLIGGLITLIVAGEFLVRGAVGIALKFNIPTLVIGMTIVSFGTSAPELLVSVKAALEGHPDLSIGNVVGSNIANIALVLGLTTMVLPITVKRSTARIDWSIMMLSSLVFYFFIINGFMEWYEGLFFILGLIAFNLYMFRDAKKDNENEELDIDVEEVKKSKLWLNIFLILSGCVGLAFGANWLLDGAVQIAKNFGVSEHVIGVTIVAFGTSVPELITSLVAAFKKHTDISVGNLIGSNIFNLLGVLGITAVVNQIPVSEQVIHDDVFWMLGISFLVFPLMIIGYRINRIRGLFLFLSYCAYIYFAVS